MEKILIARIQLERAMSLFTEHEDFVSAITLAGAAEEILGRQVEKNALDEMLDFVAARLSTKELPFDRKALRDDLCFPRNSLKHLKVGDRTDLSFPLEEAASDLIDRAVTNYVRALGTWPESDIYIRYCQKKDAIGIGPPITERPSHTTTRTDP
jgi:hypothetical protein